MKKRVISLSDSIDDYFEERANAIGVSVSNAIVMALQQYIDQQKKAVDIDEIMIQLKHLENKINKVENQLKTQVETEEQYD